MATITVKADNLADLKKFAASINKKTKRKTARKGKKKKTTRPKAGKKA